MPLIASGVLRGLLDEFGKLVVVVAGTRHDVGCQLRHSTRPVADPGVEGEPCRVDGRPVPLEVVLDRLQGHRARGAVEGLRALGRPAQHGLLGCGGFVQRDEHGLGHPHHARLQALLLGQRAEPP